jgi:23S rRNA pseudouridine2605 synthase
VRAQGVIDQAALDRLAGGVTIDGVAYLGVEAKLDREQGANAWLTLGLREGKNREIKKILEHLGLAVNRLIRVSFGPFELGDLAEGEVMEVRTRVLRDQLGVKLARQANANFNAPLLVADAPPAERRQGERPRSEGARRESQGPNRAMKGRPDRGAGGGESRFERDATPRRAPPKPSTPERRRKHVSALRAEIAADAAATRKRIERSATQDRKGRTIAVERMSRTGEEGRARAAPEERPKRAGRPNADGRGGRSFESSGRAGRSDSFGPKRGRGAEGRERSPRSDHKEPGHRPEWSNAGKREGGPRERRSDRSVARGDGDRRDRASRARDAADPARKRKFQRPEGQTHDRANESRPPRSDAKNRGARSEFKRPRAGAGAREGDRTRSGVRDTGGKGGPPRGRPSAGPRPRLPGKGSPKGAGGSRSPPRKR